MKSTWTSGVVLYQVVCIQAVFFLEKFYKPLIKGSLDEKLPSYELLKMLKVTDQ